jgi:hypothetical protein
LQGSQEAQISRPAKPQQRKETAVEAKVQRRSDSSPLSLDLSLNLPESWRSFQFPGAEVSVKGLRFERIGNNRYYNVVFHMGSSYIPVSDDIVAELKAQSLLPVERFLDLLIDRVGYSSYLKEQIRTELKSSGDPVTQITVLQGAIRDL